MKFTEGYWRKRPGFTVLHPRHVQRVEQRPHGFRAIGPTRPVTEKGTELDTIVVTYTVDAVAEGVIRVRLDHLRGGLPARPEFELNLPVDSPASVEVTETTGRVTAGELSAEITGADEIALRFAARGRELTSSIFKSVGLVTTGEPVTPHEHDEYAPAHDTFVHEQLTLDVGETVYGLGERFGPTALNGQAVNLWNSDGGTASDQAYKNVPFFMTSGGWGVFINTPALVSLEIGSEVNTRVQFSVAGQSLEYFLIDGPTPADVLRRYTALTGRAPQVPAWSYGLWLSTSFKTDYSVVAEFVAKSRDLDIPLSVVHLDCYWMRPSHWCDFVWDPEMFDDPEAFLADLHAAGLKVCVWINPYISQQSHLFDEGMAAGYLLHNTDGSVAQGNYWQPGMAWVDFTNPDACAWWGDHLRGLLRQGVDSFKTDFGERVPVAGVAWHDGSDPERMHNYYTHLYNKTVYDVIADERGAEQALVFARSATSGGQQYPVHWGGDSEPTFVSMAETLRGGLSLGLSGFGYWSHDMGGFEGKPDPDVFIRWFPFGMLSSHSRLHGSDSYRVPWIYGDDAVRVAQRFVALKHRLMPYLGTHARAVTDEGLPLLRHLILEYPGDPGVRHVDTEYLLGPDLLVAPVFDADGDVEVYLPTDGWTNILDGEHVASRGWHRQNHPVDSLPVLVPDGTVLPIGADPTRPDYDWADGVELFIVRPAPGTDREVRVATDGADAVWTVRCTDDAITVTADHDRPWTVRVIGHDRPLTVADAGELNTDIPNLAPGQRFAPSSGSQELIIATDS